MVGISNWRLDIIKSSRALLVQRYDLFFKKKSVENFIYIICNLLFIYINFYRPQFGLNDLVDTASY